MLCERQPTEILLACPQRWYARSTRRGHSFSASGKERGTLGALADTQARVHVRHHHERLGRFARKEIDLSEGMDDAVGPDAP
jgi:hypothetical protein